MQLVDRNVPRKPRLVGGVKSIRSDHGGRNMNEISSPGSPFLWAGASLRKEVDDAYEISKLEGMVDSD